MNHNQLDPKKAEEAIDRELMSDSQLRMARLVKGLPGDELNMAWRSDLNEKLRVNIAKVERKRKLNVWVWRPAMGAAFAATVCMGLLLHSKTDVTITQTSGSIESALVKAYREDEAANEVGPTTVLASSASQASSQNRESTVDPYTEDMLAGGV